MQRTDFIKAHSKKGTKVPAPKPVPRPSSRHENERVGASAHHTGHPHRPQPASADDVIRFFRDRG